MKRQITSLLLIITVAGLFAGDQINFSGDWKFNEGKSTLDQMGAQFIQSKMTVTQAENEMTVAKTVQGFDGSEMVMEEKLTLDGQACKSEFWNSPRVSTADWSEKGDALSISSLIKFEMDGQSNELDIKEVWTLSEDGKTLSIKHSSISNWGERNITMVFDRIEQGE